jgi:uncharacterized membrane protein
MNAATTIRLRDFRWAVLLVAASWLLGLWLLARLPASVPVHWNLEGQPDRYGSPFEGALLVPVIATVILALLVYLPRLDPRRANYGSFRGAYVALATGIVVFMVGIQALLGSQYLGARVDVGRLVPLAVGIAFAGIGLVLPRLRPNWFAGIRTPWTLEDDRVWEVTHRFAGRLFVVAGVLATGAGLVVPSRWLVFVLIVPILVATLGSVVYSYVAWRRLHAHASR